MALKSAKEIVPLIHVRLGHFTVSDELLHRLSTANREIRPSASLYLSDLDGFFRSTQKRKLGLIEIVSLEQLETFMKLFKGLEPSIKSSQSKILLLTRIVDGRLSSMRDQSQGHLEVSSSRAAVLDLYHRLIEVPVIADATVKTSNRLPITPTEISTFRKALAPLEKKFTPVTDPKVIDDFFIEGKTTQTKAILWTENRSNLFHVFVHDYSPESRSVRISITQPSIFNLLKKELAEKAHKTVFFNMTLRRASLFTAFAPKKAIFTEQGFTLPIEKSIFQIQRRSEFRFDYDEQNPSPTALVDGMTAKLANISAGGVKIQLNPVSGSKNTPFKTGALCLVQFSLESKNYELKSEVRWVRERSEASSPTYVGLQFKELNEIDRQAIRFYVFEKSYEYLKQFVKP